MSCLRNAHFGGGAIYSALKISKTIFFQIYNCTGQKLFWHQYEVCVVECKNPGCSPCLLCVIYLYLLILLHNETEYVIDETEWWSQITGKYEK